MTKEWRNRALAAAITVIGCLAAFAQPATADVSDLKINEVESNGGTPGDWVEIVNNGTTARFAGDADYEAATNTKPLRL